VWAYHAIAHPLDRLRAHALKRASPWIIPFVRNRDLRVTASVCLLVLCALLGSMTLPFWQLALGPVVLGIPHVIGDIRYLVVQRGLHRRLGFWLAVVAPFAVSVWSQHPGWGMAGVLGAVVTTRGSLRRKLLALTVVLGLVGLAMTWERLFLYAFIHLHNVIGIAIWWCWRPRPHRWQAISLGLIALGSLLLLFGGGEFAVQWLGTSDWHASGLGPKEFAAMLVPFSSSPLAIRFVMLFAFLQSIHYMVWIRFVPEDARAQATPRTFRRSLNRLRADLGWLLDLAVIGLVVLIGWAMVDIEMARHRYLQLIFFHGFLELAVCAILFVEYTPQCIRGSKRSS